MEAILIAASTIVFFVMAGTELIKSYTGVKNKWLPLINVLLGLFVGIAWSWSFDRSNMLQFIWGGCVAGLAAGGFYDLGVVLRESKKEDSL